MPGRGDLLRRIDAGLFDDDPPGADRFGLLLITTVATVVVLSLVDLRPEEAPRQADAGRVVVSVAVGLMLVLGARASGVRRRWFRVILGISILGVLLAVGLLIGDLVTDAPINGSEPVGPSPIWVALAVCVPVMVVRRVLRHEHVGVGTLMGAISAYLMIAVTFTFGFLTADVAQSADFFGQPAATTRFMYFSLTSITTLGYGDLTAKTDLGGLLATSEAATGQIFLVILVAALVSRFSTRPERGKG
ncbi:MAG: potassium channel family protein [Thermoleophilia bacterium]